MSDIERGVWESEPQSLADITLHRRPVTEWIAQLSRDQGRVPASRYGRTSAECAIWATACELIYVNANGEDDNPMEALNYYQGLVVNDSDSVIESVLDNWHAVPEALKERLDYEDNGMNMRQQAALFNLCGRYNVQYDASHYLVHPWDAWVMPGFAEGFVGGYDIQETHPTIYVGCDPEGRISS
jgi:hypothetical protein